MMSQRRRYGIVFTALLIAIVACFVPRAAAAQQRGLLTETFANPTTVPGEFAAGGTACLTAGSTATTIPGSIPPCATDAIDGPGAGVLRLTTTRNNDAGNVIYEPTLQSSGGLVVTFDLYAWGGDNADGSGADGVAFFFLDGTRPLPSGPGQPGGSLGYAQDCGNKPGILGGYIGLGLDEWGNFSNPNDRCKVGGPGFIPNTIAIRGSEPSQYRYVTGYGSPPKGLPFPLSKEVFQRPSPVRVRITLTPSLFVSVELDPTGTGNSFTSYISSLPIGNVNGGAFPPSFRFGWAASTGGHTNYHEIRNVNVTTAPPVLAIAKSHTGTFAAGGSGTYTINVSNVGPVSTAGATTVVDTLPTGLTYKSSTGSNWACTASGQKVTCTTSQVVPGTISPTGSPYTPLTLNVNIAPGLSGTVTNSATASGGGAANAPIANDPTQIAIPTLTLTKTSSGAFTVGRPGTFTLTPGNNGGFATSGAITVTDTLPNGLTFVSASGTGWTCTANGQTVTCVSTTAIAAGGIGAPITLVVNVGADALPSVTNPATATGGGATNTANASVTVPVSGNANLTIQKQHTGNFIVGQQGAFTLNVGNDGNVPTSANVTVTDTLPAGLTYVSATGTGWTCSAAGQIVTCVSSTVIPVGGTSNPIALVTAVGAGAIPSATNTATASGGGAPNTPTATDVVTVSGVPALTLTKSHTGNFAVGAQGTFTLLAGNNGTAATTGPVTVVDSLPNGLTFVSATGPNWTCAGAGQGVTCTTNTPIPSGGNAGPITLVVAVGPAAVPSALNTANASGGGAPNVAPATDTVAVDAPFLVLAKHHAADFIVGQPAAYTLTVSNTGPIATQGAITVTDPLPAGLTFVSTAGTGWTCVAAGQNVTCSSTTPIAAGGASNPITLNVAVAASAIPGVTNTASATGGLAPNTATASDPTTVRGLAELTLSKSHTGDFTVGAQGRYTLSVGNVGTAVTAGTITVSDALPNGLTYVSAVGTGWTCIATGQIVTCTSPQTIALGGTATPIALTVAVGAAAVPSVTNVANATGGGASNTATASDTTVVNIPVLAVTKRHSADFFVGSPGVYTLTVSNVGSAPTAGPIVVTDPLPVGLTFASAAGTGWTCAANGQLVTCTSTTPIATGAAGNPITLTVNVATTAIPSVTNVVVATGGGATNPATDRDPTIVRGVPGLTISKSHPGNFAVGTNGVYTILVGNSGSAATTGLITVTDPLPSGLTFISATGTGWVCGAVAQDITCRSTTPIPPGGGTGNPIALTVAVGEAAYPSVVNTAAASGGGAPNVPNASDPTNVDAPRLALTKHHSADFIVGQNAAYTLTVSNDGDVATGGPITVVDPLPAGLTYVSSAGAGWACTAAAQLVTCTSSAVIAAGAAGAPLTLTVVAAASAIPGVTNTASASGGRAPNVATASDPTVIRGLANLTLDKTHVGNFVVGQPGIYTLTAGNNGTTATIGTITVSDPLPAGLTFVSATGVGWTCANAGRIVSCVSQTPIPTGGTGAPITLTTTVGAAAIPRVTNVATAAGGGASNTATASDTTAVNIPQLALKKSHSGDFAVGQQGTYTLTVTNAGSASTFAPISVTDPLPNGLTFVSASGTGWTCSAAGQNVTCTSAAVVAAGAAANPIALIVTVGTAAAPSVTNTASAIGGGAPNTATASDTTNVNAPSLAIDKRHTGTFTVGKNGVYTITVSNKGMTATAGAITVSDPLPNGLTFVSATGTGWTCAANAGVVTCTSLLPIAAGAAANPITLTVAVAAAAIPEVTNTVTASGGGATNKPTASDQTVVAGTPKLTLAKTHVGDFSVGQQGTYTVTVGNAGTGDTMGAITVVDTLPSGLSYVSATGNGWTCANNAQTITCTSTTLISPTRTGNPITVVVNVLPSAVPSVTNVATASGGGNTGSVTASDTTAVTNAAILTARKLVNGQASVQVASGATVSYSIAITNTGGSTAKNVVITDPLPAGITPLGSSVQLNGSGSGVNVALSGQTLTITLLSGIAGGTTATLSFSATIEAAPNGASLVNVASVAASGLPLTQSTPASVFVGVANTVFDGTTGSASPISGAQVSLVEPASGTPLRLVAPGPPPNANNGNPFITAADGRYAFGLTPQQFGAAIRARAAANGGTATYNLLSAAKGYLNRKISAAFTPDPTGTLYTVTLTALDGQQLAVEGGFALVNRSVTLANVLNLLGNIPMFRTGAITVAKSADRQTATIGDRVVFTITFLNTGATTLTNARIIDMLPNGLAYAPGTGRVDGANVEPKVSGRQLIWTLATLPPDEPHKIVYATAVAPGTQPATLTNIVVVAAQQGNGSTVSAQATADVQIISGVFGNSLTITGRVVRDGATGPDRGVPGVRIFMENGLSVLTDAEGRFNLAEVRPGLHVLRLDTTTLPRNVHAFDDRAYDSVRSTRRLIHGITDTQLLQDVIFMVRGS